MEDNRLRRSDRVSVSLPIEVTGANIWGEVFLCEGRTELVSGHGAKIALNQTLAPDQEITVRCKETGKEVAARVVGRIGGGPKEYSYGISLLGADNGVWGIDFPPQTHLAGSVGRTVLECLACHTREVTYLDGFELEVLEANNVVARQCKRCGDSTMWKKSFDPLPTALDSTEVPAAVKERRSEQRRDLRVMACIKTREFGEELVRVVNVSRKGLCFESRHAYEEGLEIEVAIPFTSGGGNIFLRAHIARMQPLSAGVTLYGVSYLRQRARNHEK